MSARGIYIPLPAEALRALVRASERELRAPRDHAALLLIRVLAREDRRALRGAPRAVANDPGEREL